MEDEVILSGYCRCIDGSRTVMVEEGEPDCQYEVCPHKTDCQIGQSIKKITEE